jgi:hypothetical protein
MPVPPKALTLKVGQAVSPAMGRKTLRQPKGKSFQAFVIAAAAAFAAFK